MTPLTKVGKCYFKREDLNLTGSIKDRCLPFQITKLKHQGFTSAVISSTGNAAISAQHFCDLNQIKLTIFVSPHSDLDKIRYLKNPLISPQPISDATKFAHQYHAYNLRQSTDPICLQAYGQISQELTRQLPQITSIFIPVGSGTTLLGIQKYLPLKIKIFAVQSAYNPTITKYFSPPFNLETVNLTSALTVKSLPLKSAILLAIKDRGTGFTVQNQAILEAQKQLPLPVSNETFVCYSAYLHHQDIAGNFPVILATGTRR